MMLVSAPESIFHKARVCFPSGLSTRQTSKRAFSSQETTWTPLVKERFDLNAMDETECKAEFPPKGVEL